MKDMIKETSEKAARAWVLVLTSLAASMISLDSQVVATALSTIRLHLGASIEELEWTVNAYALSFAVLLMTGAALGDRFGPRTECWLVDRRARPAGVRVGVGDATGVNTAECGFSC